MGERLVGGLAGDGNGDDVVAGQVGLVAVAALVVVRVDVGRSCLDGAAVTQPETLHLLEVAQAVTVGVPAVGHAVARGEKRERQNYRQAMQ